jgi:hypothetical protein
MRWWPSSQRNRSFGPGATAAQDAPVPAVLDLTLIDDGHAPESPPLLHEQPGSSARPSWYLSITSILVDS